MIKLKRKEKKITQQQFADAIGVALRTVQYWEDGRNVEDKYVRPVADFLGITLSEVKGYESEKDEFMSVMSKISDPQMRVKILALVAGDMTRKE